MQRTKEPEYPKRLPDAIYNETGDSFTMIKNDILRNPELSFKAKGLLCTLLSNKEGKWYGYEMELKNKATDGIESIRNGMKELEKNGYLLKVNYRDITTKSRRGSFWAYTNKPFHFILDSQIKFLKENGLEIESKVLRELMKSNGTEGLDPNTENPNMGNPNMGFQRLIILNNKNINNKDFRGVEEKVEKIIPKDERITPSKFESFWRLYPKKIDKGKAKSKWETICRYSPNKRPTWKEIKKAILAQKRSQRWQNQNYIPHPTTWLNQQRWLDDPAKMISYDNTTNPIPEYARGRTPKQIIKDAVGGELFDSFYTNCYVRLSNILEDIRTEEDMVLTAVQLIRLYEQIEDAQKKAYNTGLIEYPLPGPIEIVENYIDWIDNNKWVNNRTRSLLDTSHKLFGSFRREESHKDSLERDPLSGKSYIGG